ncbi:hypothetical protein [Sphingobium chungbukense]|uniref:Uncharacterized protein n=1 Tax=Sphingobium chungbukense TaxID=56193 RepID=A0A0M3AWK5_9SPHN|nr:hypothetical protein [Sphingobium chungbukense]KKW92979.1 hypothetical protein YP76_08865 [Sphingobium chungbukense]
MSMTTDIIAALEAASCPFCGASMTRCTDRDGEFWMHPGVVTDDDCFMSGQGVFPRQLAAWNRRAALSTSPAGQEVREVSLVQARRIVDTVTEYCRGADFSCDMKAATKAIRPMLNDLASPSVEPAGNGREVETHGDWLVWHQPWPIASRSFDWHYAHKDARDDDELRTGNAESREMCLQTIDWIEEEDARAQTEEGKARTKEFVDSGMRSLNRALLAHSLKDALAVGYTVGPGRANGSSTRNRSGSMRPSSPC